LTKRVDYKRRLREIVAVAAAAIFLGRTAIVDWLTAAIALLCVILLLRWNINTLFLIVGAAIIGLLRMLLLG
jgi:chromate transporter